MRDFALVVERRVCSGCLSICRRDGGASTTLVYRSPTSKKLEVLNSPPDTKERSVADVLGVTVEKGE